MLHTDKLDRSDGIIYIRHPTLENFLANVAKTTAVFAGPVKKQYQDK